MNNLVNLCISTFGVADANCLFPLSEADGHAAMLVSPATYAFLKNQEIEYLNMLANIDTSSKSSEEIVRELVYHQGALKQVRSIITAIENTYYQTSIEGSN